MTRSTSILLAFVLTSASARAADAPRPGPAGTVTLSLSDYDRLIERAAQAAKTTAPPPIAAVLARAHLRVRVADGSARGTFALEGEVFRTGPTKVALLPTAPLLDARLTGRSLPLVADQGVLHGIVSGPGVFSVAVDWASPLASEPGRASFVLPSPSAGSVRATLDLPGEGAEVRIDPGLVTGRTSAQGRTLVEATLEPGRPARISWSAREQAVAAQARESRFLADVKTLVTLGEAEVRMAALVEVNVVQGDLPRLSLQLPRGFELTSLSGNAIESSQESSGTLEIVLGEAQTRRITVLLAFERPTGPGATLAEVPLVSVEGAQRETGEAAVEGMGTLELEAREGGTARRIDVREVDASLRAMARQPVLAAFRYHRRGEEGPSLALAVRRFPDAPVLAALAERADVTTLVTSEGRMLTEVALTVRNQAQPFLKVTLPEGASIVTADVAGESVKPVLGADGTRVPLLRPGFRPNGPYRVSFAYLHAGAALARKGRAEIALPRLDVPVSVLSWELFLPERYKVKDFGGDVLRADLLPWWEPQGAVVATRMGGVMGGVAGGAAGGTAHSRPPASPPPPLSLPVAQPNQVRGVVTDASGGPLPGARVVARGPGYEQEARAAANGAFVLNGVPAGTVDLTVEMAGFKSERRRTTLPPTSGRRVDVRLSVGELSETIEVTADSANIQALSSAAGEMRREETVAPPSVNILNLQRRVAGVLPVHVDVPRAGTSHRFVRPLVFDEETTVRFAYTARR